MQSSLLQQNIVSIKGVLTSRRIKESSFCKSCGQEYVEKGDPVYYDNGMPILRVDEGGEFFGCRE